MTVESAHDWDDVVDVICVGPGPGVSAFATVCAAHDLDVMVVGRDPGGFDADTAALLAAMTEGLDHLVSPPGSTVTRVSPLPAARRPVETFVGQALRLWEQQCLASPTGVMFTYVPDDVLAPMDPGAGELITAAVLPAGDPESAASGEILTGLVYEWGRVAGAYLGGLDGPRLVGTRSGLAFAVGPSGGEVADEAPPGAVPALVGRRAARFARCEFLVIGEDTRD